MQKNIFERYPKTTLISLLVGIGFLTLILLEFFAGLFGLGKTVLYHAHPVYGYRPNPNQCVARVPAHIVKINNIGLRAEQDWDILDFENKILFLGDSVTYGGSYITNEALFSQLMIKAFPGLISGNAGVNAWGVNNVHALVKEMNFLPAKIVVSVFPEGDFYRGLQRIGGQPFWTRKPTFALEELFQYFVYQRELKQKSAPQQFTCAQKKHIAEIAVKNLKDLDIFLKEHNREHFIYITPSRPQVSGLERDDEILKELFNQYELKVVYLIDKIAPLPPHQKKDIFHDNIHLSLKGHELWATLLAMDLQQEPFFQLNSHQAIKQRNA